MNAGGSFAAPLGVMTAVEPVNSGEGSAFHDVALGFDLTGAASSGAAAGELSVTVPFAFIDADDPFFGGALFVTYESGDEFLSGDLAGAGFDMTDGQDRIELLFGGLTGKQRLRNAGAAHAFRRVWRCGG